MEVKFTLCFVSYKEKILMLFRNKEPNKGRWNGVGGKIEQGEAPREAALREIMEESGLQVTSISYQGIVSWNNEGGMYVFLAESDTDLLIDCDEGSLAWKDIEWVMTNPEVVSNIPLFLPYMMEQKNSLQEHSFHYSDEGEIISYQKKALPEKYQLHQYN